MNKKIIIISILIILTSILITLGLHFNDIEIFYLTKTRTTNETGRVVSTPDSKTVLEAEAIGKLQNSLPFSTPGFSIYTYDYKMGKFIVLNYYKGSDLQKEFDTWYKNSTFSAIPLSMFLLEK